MKLVFAIPGDLGARTGGYRYDREVATRLPELGIEVIHCRLPDRFPHPTLEDIWEAVRLVDAALPPKAIALIDGLAYGAFPEAAISAITVPIIALVHHPLGFETGLAAERRSELFASEKAALALASRVIATSAFTAQTLEREFNVSSDRIFLARPGTDLACRAAGTDKAVSLLAVGSVIPRKAFRLLIEALAGLKDLNWRLTIAGSLRHAPETAAALEALIASSELGSRVELAGEIDSASLNRVFRRSDIFVSSSLYEGYGMALAEAMACGLPIVMAAGGAATETVPDGAALKVPAGNSAALGEALRMLILDEALRKRLSDAAWLAGRSLPTWQDTAKAIAHVIRDVTSEFQ